MEDRNTATQLLELLNHPAFLAKDGKVTQVNTAAAQQTIAPGAPIDAMLLTGQEEYTQFSQGSLHLTLTLLNQNYGASVTCFGDAHLFLLDDTQDPGLHAMALASRELREPLTAIMATVDQLFPALSGDAHADKQMAQVNRRLYQVLRLVSNMSDAQRYNRDGSQDLQIRDICAILNEIFQNAAHFCQQAGVTLEYPTLLEEIYCSADQDLLERAIYNLLSNSLRFTPKGETIRISVRRSGTMLYLTVQDSGTGIPPQVQQNLYSRYLRTPMLEDGTQGIGLGMVLVRAAAQIHGGTVLVEPCSQGGKITMTISLAQRKETSLRSNILGFDYTGERSHGLVELSDVLPEDAYQVKQIN